MKVFILITLFSFQISAEESAKKEFKEAAKKIEKREDYCSPLDKMTGKCKAKEGSTDKKILKKTQKKTKEVSKKIEKRKDYCSPLDKLMKKCKTEE